MLRVFLLPRRWHFLVVAASVLVLLLLVSSSSAFSQQASVKNEADGGPVCKPSAKPSFFVSVLGRLDSFLDKLQKGRSYNDPSSHPLFSKYPNWFPLRREEFRNDRAITLQLVEGELPADIDGVALRIGPNADPDVGFNKRLNGIIDGDGMLHSVRLDGKNNRVLYSCAYVDTPRKRFEDEHFAGRAFFLKLGEMVGLIGLAKMLLMPLKLKAFGLSDIYLGQANTALTVFDKRLYALQENALPFEIDMKENGTFESVGYQTFGGVLDYPMSAHPRVDVNSGELYFHGYSAFQKPSLKWGAIAPSNEGAKAKVTRYIDVESPSGGTPFAHDFAITENYIVLLDNSVRFNFRDILKGEVLKLDESSPLRFGISRKNATSADEIMWYTHDHAAALIHFANAWEEGNKIVLWAPIWKTFVGDVTAMTDKPETMIRMAEFSFDLQDPERRIALRDVENSAVHPTAIDFPAVNRNHVGTKADCLFAGIMQRNIVEFDGISKWQPGIGLVKNVFYGKGITGGEPIVAPKVGRGEENSCAVYVMSLIHDSNTSQSYLVMYDGEEFNDKPVAKYQMPHRVPNGLHASWMDADILSAVDS